MTPWELENWLTDEGDRIVRKVAAAPNGVNALDTRERLIYEIWLFDTEQRNGGVSQYFCNRGLDQWDALSDIASPVLASFAPFAAVVNRIVGRSAEPYKVVIESRIDLDAHYNEYQSQLLAELKATTE